MSGNLVGSELQREFGRGVENLDRIFFVPFEPFVPVIVKTESLLDGLIELLRNGLGLLFNDELLPFLREHCLSIDTVTVSCLAEYLRADKKAASLEFFFLFRRMIQIKQIIVGKRIFITVFCLMLFFLAQ